jgi:AraC-like DNA-binding protein
MEYLTNRRMETAKALILDGKHKIGEIADSLGYSPYSFSRAFKKKYGVTPMSIKDRD